MTDMSVNDEIENLERKLSYLAYQWRGQHSSGQLEAAQLTVKEYHLIFERLWKLGWDGEGLLPDMELPDKLMPTYFLERWEE